jgi:hypothetical protein
MKMTSMKNINKSDQSTNGGALNKIKELRVTKIILLSLILGVLNVVGSEDPQKLSSESKQENSGGFLTLPKAKISKKIVTDLHFGNKSKTKNVIRIYISLSCLHCIKLLVDDIDEFTHKKGSKKYHIVVKIIITSAKDLFVMKLIQNKTKDEEKFKKILISYLKRVYATLNKTIPTEEQKELFKGSKTDEDMIKYQITAKDFGFTDKEVINAIPDMTQKYEMFMSDKNNKNVQSLKELCKDKEVALPAIEKDGKLYDSFKEFK